jgi:hypothetical protein
MGNEKVENNTHLTNHLQEISYSNKVEDGFDRTAPKSHFQLMDLDCTIFR